MTTGRGTPRGAHGSEPLPPGPDPCPALPAAGLSGRCASSAESAEHSPYRQKGVSPEGGAALPQDDALPRIWGCGWAGHRAGQRGSMQRAPGASAAL